MTSDEPTPRQEYDKPKLRRFGDVAELTQAVGRTGMGDGGGTGMSMTGL